MSVERGVSLLVIRAGDFIPQVMKQVFGGYSDSSKNDVSAPDSDEIISLEIPEKCPSCGSITSFDFITPPIKKKKARKKIKKKDDSDNDYDLLKNEIDEIKTSVTSVNEESLDEAVSGQVLRCSGPQLLFQPRAMNAMAYAY